MLEFITHYSIVKLEFITSMKKKSTDTFPKHDIGTNKKCISLNVNLWNIKTKYKWNKQWKDEEVYLRNW